MVTDAKRFLLGATIALLVSSATAGCGPAAAPTNETIPIPAADASEILTNSGSPSGSTPFPVVTPNPIPTPYHADEPLEIVPGSDAQQAKPFSGSVKPAVQPARTGNEKVFRSSKPSDGLTVGAPGQDGVVISGGQTVSHQERRYTWQDGDRTLTVLLQPDLTVEDTVDVRSSQGVLAETPGGSIVERGSSAAIAPDGGPPVFRSPSGTLMTLPGGVLLVLDEAWDQSQTTSFFAGNRIDPDRVSELEYATNGYFVETQPGFPSLELANSLAAQEGVEVSSPNWWREVIAK